ncbi:MAG: ferrochelatase [Oligoflexia bacterium]|nr:ferrochelatase [Oligoflexia bacterium]
MQTNDTIDTNDTSVIDVILVQLGSPQNISYFEIRRYLKDFLSSDRVVKRDGIIKEILWMIILYLFILTLRPFKLISAYKSLCTSTLFAGEMPLVKYFNLFIEELKKKTGKNSNCNSILIFHETYLFSNPDMRSVLEKIKKRRANLSVSLSLNSKLILIPHYPIYSGPTNAIVLDEFYKRSREINLQLDFEFHFIGSYHLAKCFIDQTCKMIDQFIEDKRTEGILFDYLILSYHGMPLGKRGDKGDNSKRLDCCRYLEGVLETYFLISNGITSVKNKNILRYAFQSRFGGGKWTDPYLEDLIYELQGNNHKDQPLLPLKIAISTPGFLVDCLETLHELGNILKKKVAKRDIELYLIPCLNFRSDWVNDFAEFLQFKSSGRGNDFYYVISPEMRASVEEEIKKIVN